MNKMKILFYCGCLAILACNSNSESYSSNATEEELNVEPSIAGPFIGNWKWQSHERILVDTSITLPKEKITGLPNKYFLFGSCDTSSILQIQTNHRFNIIKQRDTMSYFIRADNNEIKLYESDYIITLPFHASDSNLVLRDRRGIFEDITTFNRWK